MANRQSTKLFIGFTDPFIIALFLTTFINYSNTTTVTDAPRTIAPRKLYQSSDFCIPGQACAQVVNHVWTPPSADFYCKCPKPYECQVAWTHKPNSWTITYNGRAQLKFCSDVSTLPTCDPNETALVKREVLEKSTNRTRMVLEIKCYCKPNHYYHFEVASRGNDESVERYNCKKFGHCKTGEFCAFLTTFTFHPYYVCTCPHKNMCLIKDKRKQHEIKELLYSGKAYRGVCTLTAF